MEAQLKEVVAKVNALESSGKRGVAAALARGGKGVGVGEGEGAGADVKARTMVIGKLKGFTRVEGATWLRQSLTDAGSEGLSDVYVKDGVEKTLLEQIPQLTEVRDVTDHSVKENAYYQ